MMEIKEECVELLTSSKIVCKEKRSRIVFNNLSRKQISKIKVEDCQITDNGVKCDYLVTVANDEHFIELKGHDVSHALKQLRRTIKLLGNTSCNKRVSYVITTRNPYSGADVSNSRLKFIRDYNSDLIVKNKNIQVKI